MMGVMTTLLVIALGMVIFGLFNESAVVIIVAAIITAISASYITVTAYNHSKEMKEEEPIESIAQMVIRNGEILSKEPVKISFSDGESWIFMRYVVKWEGYKFLIEIQNDGRVLTYQNIFTDGEP